MSKRDRVRIEKIMHDVAVPLGFPIAKELSQTWRNIGFHSEIVNPEVFDKALLLALPNGTLDPREKTVLEYDPEHYTTRRLNVAYEPKAKCPEWLAMLDRIFSDRPKKEREQIIDFLQMLFGMALFGFKQGSPRSLRKALILVGESGTGKTSIAEVLRELFHANEVAAETVDQLSTPFGLAKIMSCRAIIADDAVKKSSKLDPNVYKKLITGEPLTANIKYRDAIDFRFQGPVVITSNTIPKVNDETDAVFGRSVMIRTSRVFSEADKAKLGKYREAVPFLQAKGEFPGILNWAIDGGLIADELGHYGELGELSNTSRQWRAENDIVFDFTTRFCVPDDGFYCSLPLMAQMISCYAQEYHHADRSEWSPKKIGSRLPIELRASVPGVSVVRYDKGEAVGNVVVGLRLTDEGVLWEARAKERDMIPPGVRWKLNGKVL